MLTINLLSEANGLESRIEGSGRGRKRLLEADGFDVDLYVYNAPGEWNDLHTCSKDEFFFVVKGKMEVMMEGTGRILGENEGILAKAGVKHKHRALSKALVMVVSKWPHEHRYYSE
ncbi:MAG: cupin domain-containing protein [Nitrososphaerota archaeon]